MRLVGFLDDEPDAILAEICRQNLEGVVVKSYVFVLHARQMEQCVVKVKSGFAEGLPQICFQSLHCLGWRPPKEPNADHAQPEVYSGFPFRSAGTK